MKNKIKEIHTVATAHLDTSWLWTFEKTVGEYIPKTLQNNFDLFEKYPEYKFNFEGSYRYELMKEYYPEKFEKLRKYIESGNWVPCGSCYENGDVNTPSPEALIRNILYGNGYFYKEFGMRTNDIFLPDCFGFGKALPSVAAHCGLTGFSTQKLTWGVSVDVPFDIGRWNGNDGKGLWCSLNPGAYITSFSKIRKNKAYLKKLSDNGSFGFDKTLAYHGVGDRGGSPTEDSVDTVIKEMQKNGNNDIKVYSTSTQKFFNDMEALPEDDKARMPVFDGEFLLTEHGAGSYTSRTVSKRWNKRSELLADAAERFSSAAYALSLADYPQDVLDTAWKRVIAHQFHDDITGTSFQKCYKRNWNDYILALNSFSAEYTCAMKNISSLLDTSFVEGLAVVVSNPVQAISSRFGAVSVTLPESFNAEYIGVFDANGNEVPSQLVISNGKKTAVFTASVPSVGIKVYDIRPSDSPYVKETGLSVSVNGLENQNIKITIDKNGDIASIFNKRLGRETLLSPIKTALINDVHSFTWPAWEVKYKDVSSPAYAYPCDPVISISENGKSRVALEILRKYGNSTFKQIISLDNHSEYVCVENETDWREESSMLKTEFKLTSNNEFASYDIGIGSTKRKTNTERLFEVPAQKWADITDKDGSFGVAIFSDSRSAWDKPSDNTLRLTCMHTPMTNYRWECSQHLLDLGLNRYSYAIYAHSGTPDTVPAFAECFCQPMHTFVTEAHAGTLGNEYSFFSIDNEAVRTTAIKKKQDSEMLVVRFAESSGNAIENVIASFSLPITKAYVVRGDEVVIEEAQVKDGKLVFDIEKNGIKSFAIELQKVNNSKIDTGKYVELPYNSVAITKNENRSDSTLPQKISVPHELLPENYLYAGTSYRFNKEGLNAVVCRGQQINVDKEAESLELLLTSINADKTAVFKTENGDVAVTVCDCFENVGAWDLVGLGELGYIKENPQAISLTHTHTAEKDEIGKNFNIFHAKIALNGAKTLTFPNDEDIVIFAATAKEKSPAFENGDSHFDTLEKREFDYKISNYAKRKATPAAWETLLDKRFNRTSVAQLNFKIVNLSIIESLGELYYVFRLVPNLLEKGIRRTYTKLLRSIK